MFPGTLCKIRDDFSQKEMSWAKAAIFLRLAYLKIKGVSYALRLISSNINILLRVNDAMFYDLVVLPLSDILNIRREDI